MQSDRLRQVLALAQELASAERAKAKDAEPILEALAALGVLVAYDAEDGRRWKSAASAS